MLLGYFAGAYVYPNGGGVNGLFIAIFAWIILSFVSIFGSKSIFLSISKAKEVKHSVHPQLFNVVEEMKISANLPAMPKIYIMHERAPNAFATGVSPEDSAIVVTSGLLERLNRDELQGVIAHEMAHILNRDVRFLTMAGILLGSITLVSEVFLRGLYYGGSSRRYSSRSSSSGGGQAQAVIMIVAILVAILAPILARIFYFAISRKREYLADATAARLTRYPEGLASALEKISDSAYDLSVGNKIMAPMYISNPLKKKKKGLSHLSSTHPPIEDRIKILRNMMHGAGYQNYQESYEAFLGRKESLIPASGLKITESVPIRSASAESSKPASGQATFRNLGDIVRAANGFAFLTCACGLKIKLPDNYKKSSVDCPRCKSHLDFPVAELAAMTAATDTALKGHKTKAAPKEKLKFTRTSKDWESFQCKCGHRLQLSPLFAGTNMPCPKCRRVIEVSE